MIIALACVLAMVVIAFILGVRAKDLPEPEPESPFLHLDERKAAIYENLRDLQFEYRVGKLSDQDYQNTKKDLQRELASVLAEVDALKARLNGAEQVVVQVVPRNTLNGLVCASCGAKFEKPLKFCGECGKPMKVAQS
jgi:NADH pyrophosphatase NudC (nudix superfamily)